MPHEPPYNPDQAFDGAGLRGDDRNESDDDAIARLAALSPMEYDRCRLEEADRLGVRVGTLDAMVASERGDNPGNGEGGGSAVVFPEPEPWPDAVDGAALLDALAGTFARHIAMSGSAADAAALWTVHAHAHDTAAISPILAVTSPAPECGKTTLLTALEGVVPKRLGASNITAASLFRAVEKWRPTLLIDEGDTFIRDNDELRGVLNSGHNRAAAYIIRNVSVGDDYEPRRFTTWAPKAIALIGKLPPTLASRSIHIELRRLAPGETVEPVRPDRLDHLEPLARQAARWTADHDAELREADPDMPAVMTGRPADNWRHLVAIADLAGGDWPRRARQAAETMGAADQEMTAAIMLLEDIRVVFQERACDRIPSADLAGALGQMETRPWSEWRRGQPITMRGVAKLLEPFGIAPQTIRMGAETAKGYRRDQFDDAFARYLPDDPSHRNERLDAANFDDSEPSQQGCGVTDEMGAEASDTAVCDGVTDNAPLPWADML